MFLAVRSCIFVSFLNESLNLTNVSLSFAKNTTHAIGLPFFLSFIVLLFRFKDFVNESLVISWKENHEIFCHEKFVKLFCCSASRARPNFIWRRKSWIIFKKFLPTPKSVVMNSSFLALRSTLTFRFLWSLSFKIRSCKAKSSICFCKVGRIELIAFKFCVGKTSSSSLMINFFFWTAKCCNSAKSTMQAPSLSSWNNKRPHSKTVDVDRGKNPLPEKDDNFDDFSYEDVVDDDYNSYNFSELYKEKVGQYIVALRQSATSKENFRSIRWWLYNRNS